MVMLRRIISGFRRLFHKPQVEQELDEELRAFLESAAEAQDGCGTDPRGRAFARHASRSAAWKQ